MPPAPSKKLIIASALISLIGLETQIVSSIPADAKDRIRISKVAKSLGKAWTDVCKTAKRPASCCGDLQNVHDANCQALEDSGFFDEEGYRECITDNADAYSICLRGVAAFISPPPSLGEDPLKVAPSTPTFRQPKLVPPAGALGN